MISYIILVCLWCNWTSFINKTLEFWICSLVLFVLTLIRDLKAWHQDVTNVSGWLQNIGLCSVRMTFDLYLMIQCTLILLASPEEMPNFVAAYNKQGDTIQKAQSFVSPKLTNDWSKVIFVHRETQGLRFNRSHVKPHPTSRFYLFELCYIFHLRWIFPKDLKFSLWKWIYWPSNGDMMLWKITLSKTCQRNVVMFIIPLYTVVVNSCLEFFKLFF